MHFFDERFRRRQAEERAKKEHKIGQAFADIVKREGLDGGSSMRTSTPVSKMLPNTVDAVIAEEQHRRKRLDELHRRMFPQNYDLSELW